MQSIKYKPLALAIAAAFAAPAIAQDSTNGAGAAPVEEVVVTGFRGALRNALNTKRESIGVVDAIYAEDMADFPDNNLADALGRIPGIAISRSGGEGRNITVRGLGPDYTRIRINGMESMSSTGGTDAEDGNNTGRGFDFNTFSSELFSNVVVHKTNSAEVDAGSLGATVELNSARPMELDELVLTAAVQLGRNDKAGETDPKVTAFASKQFSDSFGALVAISRAERTVLDDGSSTVRWSGGENFTGANNPGYSEEELIQINETFHPRIPRYDSYEHTIERTGAALTLQWLPTEATDIALDVLLAKHDATRSENFLQGVMNSSSIFGGYTLNDNYVIEGNSLVYAEIPNATLRSESRYDEMTTDYRQITLSVNHEFSEQLKLKTLIGDSSSEFENGVQNTVLMQANGVGMTWDYRGDGLPALTFGEGAYQPENWTMNSLRQRPQGTNNSFTTAMAELSFEMNEAITLKGGLSVKQFEFDTYQARYSSENDGTRPDAAAVDIQTPGYIMSYDSDLGSGPAWLIPNRELIAANEGLLSNQGRFATEVRERDTYGVTEDTTSAFVQMDFNSQLGEIPVSGNVGFRYFTTDQASTGWFDTNGDGDNEQILVKHSYDDILPSLNLRFDATDDVIIRASISEGIARAGLGSLKADQSASVSGNNLAITGGNPFLEPTKAVSYDLSTEIYLSDESAMSVTVFRKDIESHVQTLKEQATGAELAAKLNIPLADIVDACEGGPNGYGPECNENLLWDRSAPLNGPGGTLNGFELSFQTTFGALGSVFENVGFIGNYTYVKSPVTYVASNGDTTQADILKLSDTTQSATIYYEDETVSARFAWSSRSDYLTDAFGRNSNNQEGTYGTNSLDFSSSYTINDHWKVSFEALNLTDTPNHQWVDRNDNRLSYYHEAGKQFYLGAQYKF